MTAAAPCVYCAKLVAIELTWPDGRQPGQAKTCGHCGGRRRRVVLALDFDPRQRVLGADREVRVLLGERRCVSGAELVELDGAERAAAEGAATVCAVPGLDVDAPGPLAAAETVEEVLEHSPGRLGVESTAEVVGERLTSHVSTLG